MPLISYGFPCSQAKTRNFSSEMRAIFNGHYHSWSLRMKPFLQAPEINQFLASWKAKKLEIPMIFSLKISVTQSLTSYSENFHSASATITSRFRNVPYAYTALGKKTPTHYNTLLTIHSLKEGTAPKCTTTSCGWEERKKYAIFPLPSQNNLHPNSIKWRRRGAASTSAASKIHKKARDFFLLPGFFFLLIIWKVKVKSIARIKIHAEAASCKSVRCYAKEKARVKRNSIIKCIFTFQGEGKEAI